MIEQKAKEYAAKAIADVSGHLTGTAFASGIIGQLLRDTETLLQQAYRAGYQAGLVDATRREFIQPQQENFERGMT